MLGKSVSNTVKPPSVDAHNKNKKQFPVEIMKQKQSSFNYEQKQVSTVKKEPTGSMKIMDIN